MLRRTSDGPKEDVCTVDVMVCTELVPEYSGRKRVTVHLHAAVCVACRGVHVRNFAACFPIAVYLHTPRTWGSRACRGRSVQCIVMCECPVRAAAAGCVDTPLSAVPAEETASEMITFLLLCWPDHSEQVQNMLMLMLACRASKQIARSICIS